MQAPWRALFEQLSTEFSIDEARRGANFVLAAGLAGDASAKKPAPQQLVASANRLAAAAGSPLVVGQHLARTLAKAVETVAAGPLHPDQFDAWVEAFQSADGRRKSLGAFATPSPFADALAKILLPEGDIAGTYRALDPSAGAGNLLAAVYRALVARGWSPAGALGALHGMELDPAARELCILHLWLLAPAPRPPIGSIARRIRLGNALTHDWWSRSDLFDGLIMNPPWESLRHPASCESVEAERLATIERLRLPADVSEDLPPLYSCHGRGDRNLFKAFVELAPHLLKAGGRLSALLPAAFGSDDGMAALRGLYLDNLSTKSWITFENRGKYFAIDSRYKFGLLDAERTNGTTGGLEVLSFCTHPHEVAAPRIHVDLDELEDLFGKDRMIPELTHPLEWDIIRKMARNGHPLFEPGPLGSVAYRREVDLSLGRATGRFIHVEEAERSKRGDLVPLIEGRMVGQYDCFQKSFEGGCGRTAAWQLNGERPVSGCRPQFVAPPIPPMPGRIAICDITSATNARTVIATLVPDRWLCGNTAPVLQFDSEPRAFAGLAIMNSLTFDWMARRIVSGLHLNKFYLACLRWPCLSEAEAERLSHLGRTIAAAFPRGGLATEALAKSPNSRLAALAEAETLIIEGYGLGVDEVSAMLGSSRSDRRGFWRFYENSEEGRALAEQVLELVGRSKRLAA